MYKVIAELPYYKVERAMTSFAQETLVHQRVMYLYETKIVSSYREFPILEVYDMSFRNIGEDHGILYLHTKQGVYPFTVKTVPTNFIQAFKELLHKISH
ncbi:hypothetical protein H1230_21550 [Paenibacillus sp. 19GGS1-52]|uniref:hypothetical protein n=1 Tax=Paenibacillus sp. 19GGS1-52 TaxID=2758563 RepID=UPI001EFBF449|nr:hypothetical protein [Paenibacillus sp. 19GGS1-52]ULO05642.1 hypothetical protein H1230_21550 [Paenibacillus sp. 19GGS1-52]